MRSSRSRVAQQPAIQAFTRATKAGITQLPAKNTLTSTKSLPVLTQSLPVSPSKKRKLQELENFDNGTVKPIEEEGTPSKTLRLNELSVNSPRSGHYASPKKTPSRRGRAPAQPSTPSTPSKQRTLNFEKVPVLEETPVVERPAFFNDILNLHSAFVQGFSIHMAHNGANTPADLREFLGNVTRLWNKRKVQTKDLQRILWVWEQSTLVSSISYRMANYGLGKICIERTVHISVQPPIMQDSFEEALELLWAKAPESLRTASEEEQATLFNDSFGQQRLQDLKGGLVRLNAERLRAEKVDMTPLERKATVSRGQGLLDRIKNKQLRQSKLPPPPSKLELVRLSAADRVEEIAGILAMLRPAGTVGNGIRAMLAAQRKPFKLDVMIEHVRDSIRSEIAPDEVVKCLEILADSRVAGSWVSIVTIGSMKSVVLKSCRDVCAKDIAAKVDQLKAEWSNSASVQAPALSA
ncbi:unnamed protein product [Penicillium bialowiezense]